MTGAAICALGVQTSRQVQHFVGLKYSSRAGAARVAPLQKVPDILTKNVEVVPPQDNLDIFFLARIIFLVPGAHPLAAPPDQAHVFHMG